MGTNKKIVEKTFDGTYNDVSDNEYKPKVGNDSLAYHIANELKGFEGKKVKVKLTMAVEEIE